MIAQYSGRLFPGSMVLLSLIALVMAGCSSVSPSNADRVTELHLLGTPVAVDLDGKPGADGVGIRVYASTPKTSSAVRIPTGSLKIMLYDGIVAPKDIPTASPLASVSYTAGELRKFEYKTAVGISYNFVPRWDREPLKNRVTVIAVYERPGSPVVRSGLITVPLPNR